MIQTADYKFSKNLRKFISKLWKTAANCDILYILSFFVSLEINVQNSAHLVYDPVKIWFSKKLHLVCFGKILLVILATFVIYYEYKCFFFEYMKDDAYSDRSIYRIELIF